MMPITKIQHIKHMACPRVSKISLNRSMTYMSKTCVFVHLFVILAHAPLHSIDKNVKNITITKTFLTNLVVQHLAIPLFKLDPRLFSSH